MKVYMAIPVSDMNGFCVGYMVTFSGREKAEEYCYIQNKKVNDWTWGVWESDVDSFKTPPWGDH